MTSATAYYINSIAYFLKGICLLIVLLFFKTVAFAQNCPDNIDFELGDFTGWQCYTGNVINAGGINRINLTSSGPIAGRHEVLSSFPGNGVDPFGGFPVNCPNGSGHSIKLGNTSGGAEAEGVSYTFTIPANRNEYNLIYHYAVVFQDPNHQQYEQPRMEIEITNLSDNKKLTALLLRFFLLARLYQVLKSRPTPEVTPLFGIKNGRQYQLI